MRSPTRFQSFLGPDVERFLAYKRSLGRRFDVEEKALVLLDAYLLRKRIRRYSQLNRPSWTSSCSRVRDHTREATTICAVRLGGWSSRSNH